MPRSSVDYADYNITIYRLPCPYSCRYCWAWRVPINANRIMRGKYEPLVEARKYARVKHKRIVVSFTSDPYPFMEAWHGYTRRVLEFLRFETDNIIMVLTKNPVLALRDRHVFTSITLERDSEAWLGTTITSADKDILYSAKLEPFAPRTALRLRALQELARTGGYVWVSIEPIIPVDHIDFYPETIVSTILEYLDPEHIKLVVLGRLNYINQIKKYMPISLPSEKEAVQFYREHLPKAIEILEQHNIQYHIKKELARILENGS